MTGKLDVSALAETLALWAADRGFKGDSSSLVAALHDIGHEISVGISASVVSTTAAESSEEEILQSLSDLKRRFEHIRVHSEEAAKVIAELTDLLENRKPS